MVFAHRNSGVPPKLAGNIAVQSYNMNIQIIYSLDGFRRRSTPEVEYLVARKWLFPRAGRTIIKKKKKRGERAKRGMEGKD